MATWKDLIEAANAKFMTFYAEGNSEGIGGLYTEDCSVMPTGSDVITGRAGAASVFAGAMKSGVKSLLLKSDEVGPLDASDTAFERGHYTFYKADGTVIDQGKYVVVWKKIDSQPYMHVDIWNSNKA